MVVAASWSKPMQRTLIATPVAVTAIAVPGWTWAQDAAAPERYVYYPHMMGWGDGWTGMFFGPLFMLLLVALAVGLIVMLFRRGGDSMPQGRPQTPGATALDILKERFARGEIDQQEYESRRRVLSE
jgi:putative membrane protein